jgi:hypothetical protein
MLIMALNIINRSTSKIRTATLCSLFVLIWRYLLQ